MAARHCEALLAAAEAPDPTDAEIAAAQGAAETETPVYVMPDFVSPDYRGKLRSVWKVRMIDESPPAPYIFFFLTFIFAYVFRLLSKDWGHAQVVPRPSFRL